MLFIIYNTIQYIADANSYNKIAQNFINKHFFLIQYYEYCNLYESVYSSKPVPTLRLNIATMVDRMN